MTETLEELGKSAVDEFLQRIREIPSGNRWRAHDEARRLETEVVMLFKATVLETKKMVALADIARAWEELGLVCAAAVEAISALRTKETGCNVEVFEDRLAALGAKCQRFQKLHS